MSSIWKSLRVDNTEVILAQKVLKTFGDDGLLINLQEILSNFGIVLKEMPDYKYDKARGQFLESGPDGNPTIYLDTKHQSYEMQRFVLAHELGHYLMKHGSMIRDTLYVINSSDDREQTANSFATELILPKKGVEKLFQNGVDFKKIAQYFSAPNDLTQTRLKKLGFSLNVKCEL